MAEEEAVVQLDIYLSKIFERVRETLFQHIGHKVNEAEAVVIQHLDDIASSSEELEAMR